MYGKEYIEWLEAMEYVPHTTWATSGLWFTIDEPTWAEIGGASVAELRAAVSGYVH